MDITNSNPYYTYCRFCDTHAYHYWFKYDDFIDKKGWLAKQCLHCQTHSVIQLQSSSTAQSMQQS